MDLNNESLEGFLNLFFDFMKDTDNSIITSTVEDEFKYFHTKFNKVIIIICTDLKDEDTVINTKITSIILELKEKFGELLKNGEWRENKSLFSGFERDIDEILLEHIRIAIIGMGSCGKTDVLRLISGKNNLEYQPIINVEICNYDGSEIGVNRSIELWDFAGQSNFRNLWKSLLDSTDIALLVLDSTFENAMQSKEILRDILNDKFNNKLIIGIANNQDLPNRLNPRFIEKILNEPGRDPPIRVHGIIAKDASYREVILEILRDAINNIFPSA
jgi:small GTP-binding protein